MSLHCFCFRESQRTSRREADNIDSQSVLVQSGQIFDFRFAIGRC